MVYPPTPLPCTPEDATPTVRFFPSPAAFLPLGSPVPLPIRPRRFPTPIPPPSFSDLDQ
jgi:hypothetical protein